MLTARPAVLCLASLFVLVVSLLPVGSTTSASKPDHQSVLTGTVTRVIDGDTLDVQLSSGPIKVRLQGIDTPEKKQSWGPDAASFLSSKILRKSVDLEPISQDRYDRQVAIVHAGDVNVNHELVRLGHAWAYRQYMRKADKELCAAEAEARAAHRGLWKLESSPVAPWEYRARKKRESFTDYSKETVAQCVASIGRKSK